MTILRQKVDMLTHHYPPQELYKLLKKNIISKEYVEYQFMQKSKIPTMHFQQSLPRLPIPKLDLTCERYLAAQRPLLIDEAYNKTQYNVNQFKSNVGRQLQDMLKNYDKQNKHTSYISEFWFDSYLRDRKPIPINYNPVLVMHKDERPEYNDQLLRTANLIISSLRFYKSLHAGILEPEVFHLNQRKVIPRSLGQFAVTYLHHYHETDKDRLFNNPQGKHITVQYKGHFYAFRVLSDENDILPPDKILARLKFILEENIPKCEFPIGVLTTMERNKWATIRHELADNGNEHSLKLIDSALFNVCLDKEILGDDPYAIIRNFLHSDGENRWFDKSFSLQLSKDGQAAVNFEHAWGDGVAILRYVQDIYKDSREKPFVHPNTKPYDDDIANVIRLGTEFL
ncbi:hypothetical protein NQ318_015576 [Aromia moschata]|uniref:Choline/carnitine acyltransferase domain-containing protein n=1 Tax=Aromia moschata TaxID=1265417 RepID=A0AAV8XCP5_9CUCU|nr:hypothetical protein NQ318_015576 [Aromia moschata]